MESLIFENFKNGNLVEVYVKGNAFPIEAKFGRVSRGGVLLRTESGKKIVLSVDSILMIKQGTAPAPKPSPEQKPKETIVIPAEEADKEIAAPEKRDELTAGNQPADETSATDVSAPSSSTDEVSTEGETLGGQSKETLFRLPSEQNAGLKIVGSITLSEADKKKNIFNKPEPKPIGTSKNLPKPQINEDDFESTEIPQMGILKSVGPVYGYIKLAEGPDVYVNRGEFIYRKDDQEILTPGDPVVYSVGSNWKGLMAKCVHRPMTVGEHIDFIEELVEKDSRNAKLLARQLLDIFPGNNEVVEALSDFPQLNDL